MDENAKIPGADAPVEERLLFLQENMVNFVKQYSLPVIEVSLVVSKYIRLLLESLEKAALESGEIIPENIAQPWEIESELESLRNTLNFFEASTIFSLDKTISPS